MKILTLENRSLDLNELPEEIEEDLRFSVLDNSNVADPDFFFMPLIFLESFNSPAILLNIGGIRRARSAREIRDLDHAREIKETLEKAEIVVKSKVGSTGVLFGSVTDKDITAGIKAATGLDIDRHRVKVAGHIKKLGKYTAKVSLQGQVSANVNISVEAI